MNYSLKPKSLDIFSSPFNLNETLHEFIPQLPQDETLDETALNIDFLEMKSWMILNMNEK